MTECISREYTSYLRLRHTGKPNKICLWQWKQFWRLSNVTVSSICHHTQLCVIKKEKISQKCTSLSQYPSASQNGPQYGVKQSNEGFFKSLCLFGAAEMTFMIQYIFRLFIICLPFRATQKQRPFCIMLVPVCSRGQSALPPALSLSSSLLQI